MKKIISASQTRAADEFTIQTEPIASIALMERAATCFVEKLLQMITDSVPVTVLVGPGNNGGDGLAICRLLQNHGFTVRLVLKKDVHFSPDALVNYNRVNAPTVFMDEDISLQEDELVIDALFGTGLSRPLSGHYAALIKKVNESKTTVVAVDIPSGMYADDVIESDAIIIADHTITFQRPKLSFLWPESGQYCGELHVVNIGLDEDFIDRQQSHFFLLESEDVKLKSRPKFAHKGVFGHVQVFAGSKGKMGAAVLAAKAALTAGAGLVTGHVPARGELILQTSVPEVMLTIDSEQDHISEGKLLPKVNAICIGPGIGQALDTVRWLSAFVEETDVPVVLDADAINILSSNQHLLGFLKNRAILTPHLGELERLIGKTAHGKERLERVISFAEKHHVVVLIKGAYSAIVGPGGDVFFNPTGNPGLAKGGSGDVLAGLITGFVAQGFSLEHATFFGVYYHGLAADLVKVEKGELGIMASDLLHFLPKAFSNV